jgi:hypothetical protein
MSEEPMTELAEGAVQTHELYTAYVDAGFTPDQAMQLIIAFMIKALGGGG